MESLAARIFGPYWVGWDLPRHLYLFPRPLLQTVLGTLGFRSVAFSCISGSYSTLRDSLEFWTQSWISALSSTRTQASSTLSLISGPGGARAAPVDIGPTEPVLSCYDLCAKGVFIAAGLLTRVAHIQPTHKHYNDEAASS